MSQASPKESPTFWVIAGGNGAGKTTVARQCLDSTLEILNPDEYAKKHYGDYSAESLFKGAKDIITIIKSRIRQPTHDSFAVETTFSGRMHLRLMQEAKRNGWKIGFIYIGTHHYRINIYRVSERIQRGGHYVTPEDIQRRYYKSIQNIRHGLQLADTAYIFDNSGLELQLLLTKQNGNITHEFQCFMPEWLGASGIL